MKKFRRYYLLPFVGLGSIALFGWYQNKGTLDFIFTLFLIFIGIILPACIGFLRDRFEHQWLPKKRKEAYTKAPFLELIQRGFKNKDDVYLEGEFEGYTVFIIYDRRLTTAVSLIFFYRPEKLDEKHYNDFLKKIARTKFEMSVLGNLLTKVECRFKPCGIEAIESRLKEGVEFLQTYHYKPIDPLELKRMYENKSAF